MDGFEQPGRRGPNVLLARRRDLALALAAVLAGGMLAGCATTAPQSVRSELAPTGTLRVGLNLNNTLLTRRDPAGGDPGGIAIDIARELGRRIGVPVRFVPYDTPAGLGGSIASGQWDVAFFAIEASRAAQIDFSAPYVGIETTYMVRSDSPLRSADEIDRDGHTVAVSRGAGYEPVLVGLLKRAKLVRADGQQALTKLLRDRQVDAFTGLRPALVAQGERETGLRVLDGNFVTVGQAIGVQRGRPAAFGYVNDFVQDIKRSGFVAQRIEANGVRGLTILP